MDFLNSQNSSLHMCVSPLIYIEIPTVQYLLLVMSWCNGFISFKSSKFCRKFAWSPVLVALIFRDKNRRTIGFSIPEEIKNLKLWRLCVLEPKEWMRTAASSALSQFSLKENCPKASPDSRWGQDGLCHTTKQIWLHPCVVLNSWGYLKNLEWVVVISAFHTFQSHLFPWQEVFLRNDVADVACLRFDGSWTEM